MDPRSIATQLLKNIESMVDPNAPMEHQLSQMRAQMAVLSELPNLINRKMDLVSRNITQITTKKSVRKEVYQQQFSQQKRFAANGQPKHSVQITEIEPDEELYQKGIQIRITKPSLTDEDLEKMKNEQWKELLAEKQKPNQKTATRAKPTPAFGSGNQERPLYLPGGRRWRMSDYDEDRISETLVGQAEVIKGNAIGVNFKKFERPPIGLDHLKNSEVYRAVHNIDETPLKRVELLGPAIAASEIRERVRSMSPATGER